MYLITFSTALSSPYPLIHYIGTENVKFAQGVSEMADPKKNRLICFSDSAGTVMIMTITASTPTPNELEEIERIFQKELDWLRRLDDWNEIYKKEFGLMGENDVDDNDYKSFQSSEQPNVVESENIKPILSKNNIHKVICEETFK